MAERLPPRLTQLSLDFGDPQIRDVVRPSHLDAGARAVAERLPLLGLTRLHLDFGGCWLADAVASAVAERLPPGLTQLVLNFGGCCLCEAGVRALAERLPPGLTQLSLNFGDWSELGWAGERAVIDLVPADLRDGVCFD